MSLLDSAAMAEPPDADAEPLSIDAGLMLVVDPRPSSLPKSSSTADAAAAAAAVEKRRERLLREHATSGVSALVASLFALPRVSDPTLGPLACLPAPHFTSHPCPRAKPLPPPSHLRPLTKWQAFAKAKGIAPKSKREKLVFDEETQQWRPRWGFRGANKDEEDSWIQELPNRPLREDESGNPAADARRERKKRRIANEAKHLKNLERTRSSAAAANKATPSSAAAGPGYQLATGASAGGAPQDADKARRAEQRQLKKAQLEADLRRGGVSTASMGKFDRKLQGEGKAKGVKRKFAPNEDASTLRTERASQLAVLSSLQRGVPSSSSSASATKKGSTGVEAGGGGDGLVNVRKAIKWQRDHGARNGGGGGGADKAKGGKKAAARKKK